MCKLIRLMASSKFAFGLLNTTLIVCTTIGVTYANQPLAIKDAIIACQWYQTELSTRMERRCKDYDFPEVTKDGKTFYATSNVAKDFNALLERVR